MKNILAIFLLASSLILTCCGNGDKKTTEELIQADTIPAKPSIPLLKPEGWVSDLDTVFTSAQVRDLDSIIAVHEKGTTNEIAVITYNITSDELEKAGGLEKYSLTLFDQLGVGKKDKNNGVGILILKGLRKIRIEVGHGLESKLTNEEAQHIIDSLIIPDFKNQDYYSGTLKAIQAIIKEIQ